MEGVSVTLNTGVTTNQQEKIRWYYNDIRIAQITGDLGKICTDVQCNEGNERFRDRLKLDNQTGSLTIRNISTTDAGLYHLEIIRNISISEKIFIVAVHGVSAAERDEVEVMEGESVTLDPSVLKHQNYVKRWYFNDFLIAEITGDQSQICTDDPCEERFRDRLKLDHQTGSLTVTDTTNTDSGVYKLLIISDRFSIRRIFSVTVTDSYVETSALHLRSGGITIICVSVILLLLFITSAGVVVSYCLRNRKRTGQKYGVRLDLKMEGQSVTLDSDIEIQTDDHIQWMFGDTNSLIAEIKAETGEPKVYYDGADGRFIDRLEIDKKTGSLILRISRTTDSGDFKLQINRNGKTSFKRFRVTVSCSSENGIFASDQIEIHEIKVPLI